ncbi:MULTISPECIES: sulfonate ABC transporter substrate-binding protein [unclassified Methylibium]|jgi:NitT/TauT family transport system substrate-binding protein/sulfonate transport system substrate-binding protein|uniref:sulfonate ABC transporter substrate-binding protein n=1 Tax=unclassified Methylibium TaxID=2633235 RepID=UPI0006FC6EAB|nr:sulfonate ABC transporter substrate-binding protein [Methylibium sp. Root1272]KQW68706.1 ABC transporter substrate-binding protein [Methylibium sp. Root1272]
MTRSTSTPSRRALLEGALKLGLAVGTAAIGRGAHAAEPKLLRIGYQKFNTLNILKGAGSLEAALKPLGYGVQWFEFATGPVLLEALNAGSIDFGHAADTPSVFAQAAGVNAVYLAAEQPYPQGIAILVPKDSPLKSVAELKGKKVAIGRGWNVQYLLVRALEDAGLSFDDIQPAWVNNAADARTAFESGKVDAVGLWDPFLAGAQLASNPRVLRNGEGLSNNRTFYIANPQYAAAHGPALRTVFAELRKTNDWADKNPQAVADQLAPQLGVPPAVLRLATERRRYTAVPVDAGIVAEQQRIADTFYKLKLIPRTVQVRDAVFKDVLL